MAYLSKLSKPTRIYHKKCSHCGLNYLGKSVQENIEMYSGSGKRWTQHLKKHKAKSIHVWSSDWFYDESIKEYALNLSESLNIVDSKEWANLKPENGIDGGAQEWSEVSRKRLSETITGRKQSDEWIAKRNTKESNAKKSQSHKLRLSESKTLQKHLSRTLQTKAARKKAGKTFSTLKWFTNGVESVRRKECPGAGWIEGKTYTAKIKKCEVCGVENNAGVIGRYHNQNCKSNL
jgi:hypothetical protein